MSPHRSDYSVLVIASDAMLGALVGALVERAALKAAFPAPGERAEDAMQRVRPLAALLVDVSVDEAASDVFALRTRKRGIPILLFGGRDRIGALTSGAEPRSSATFVLPDAMDALVLALERIPAEAARRSTTERRARAERGPDGLLIFFDRHGRRWTVLDRRGTDRRQTLHRRFVADDGSALGCDVPDSEARTDSVEILEAQLALATPEPS